jgi:hypothetical protein
MSLFSFLVMVLIKAPPQDLGFSPLTLFNDLDFRLIKIKMIHIYLADDVRS